MTIENRPWDSSILGWKCGELIDSVENPATTDYDFVWTRRDLAYFLGYVQVLEFLGFRFVEVQIKLVRDLVAFPPKKITIPYSIVTEEDGLELGDLTGQIFTYDRLHADFRIPRELADKYKRAWGISACGGYADRVFLVKDNQEIDGFVAIRNNALYLIGVHPRWQRQGIGSALVELACGWTKEQGYDTITTATQGANIPALRMYQGCHFQITNMAVGLHWLREGLFNE